MNVSNLSQLLQKNPLQANSLFSGSKRLLGQAKAPVTALQQISNQIIAKQQSDEKTADLVKAQELRMDSYTKTESADSLDKAKDEVLQLYLHIAQVYVTTSGNREKELMSFKEHLQGLDQTIQGYQDMLDGKTALQQGRSMEEIAKTIERVKQYREQFITDGIKDFSHGKAVYGNKIFDRYANTVFGKNPFAGKDPSVWEMDASAPDIYAEIDRVLEETRSFKTEMQRGVDYLSGLLRNRGYGDIYTKNWETQHTEYRSSYDKAVDARKLELERLKHAPLYDVTVRL